LWASTSITLNGGNKNLKNMSKNIGVYLIIFGLVLAMAWFYNKTPQEEIKDVNFSVFTQHVVKQEIKEIYVDPNSMLLIGTLADDTKVQTVASSILEINWLNENYIYPQSAEGVVKQVNEPPYSTPWYISILPTAIMMVLLLVFFWFMVMNQGGANNKAMSFGKSKARLQKDSDLKKLTFADVAGLDEEKEELEEIVDFLKFPKKYRNLGARIPKGILLVGPPGTGKTYISRAAAGEAGVPFFTISGSDFVEMFVGVGASRVRDLFDQAKKNSPCIVFIDEIDAVGRRRGAGMGGGHDEREQTLNQLLVEMDGFAENLGIIILAATNRPDILDPALLRPGRFDRQIFIGVPDIKAREAIFRIHSKNKPLDDEVEPKVLARRTPGFTPADIENMLNEAALLTARRNGLKIRMEEVEEAITKVIAGPEKKSRVISEPERKLTAYHEAGHAIVAASLPNTDPVHQITIVPRGRAGGFTMILPKEDRYYTTKTNMEEQIIHLLGGRVAEELTLHDISTGASNDIMRATEIAKEMVTKYGFSAKLGPVNYSSSEEVFLGKDFTSKQNYSEETASEIDAEVKAIIIAAYARAEQILKKHTKQLDSVAKALLELETLDGVQFKALYDGKTTAKQLAEEVKAQEHRTRIRNEEEAAGMMKLIAQQEEDEAKELMEPDSDELPSEDELAIYDKDYFNEDVVEELKAKAPAKAKKPKAKAPAVEASDEIKPVRARKPKAEASTESTPKTKPAPKKPSPKKPTKKDE
jgi:cell division protease FtsH